MLNRRWNVHLKLAGVDGTFASYSTIPIICSLWIRIVPVNFVELQASWDSVAVDVCGSIRKDLGEIQLHPSTGRRLDGHHILLFIRSPILLEVSSEWVSLTLSMTAQGFLVSKATEKVGGFLVCSKGLLYFLESSSPSTMDVLADELAHSPITASAGGEGGGGGQ